ncbi:UNVERIFIED_CONTAM: Retrovirus-related Pol polyprotein from transposon TNT 1-94 [Sesamum angustifolium]|uniref:Retrovirus-related Pol polyprotein from transposon TNT 1-94 n=1 Tax=Sesamum angustifolium TaxID=2727405 RepID=A0AAW2ISX5_9LAMI
MGLSCPRSSLLRLIKELKRMLDIPYASAVGSIQYAAQCTRHDTAYALSVTRRYQACAREAHWTAVKTILKYLKRTKDVFLLNGGVVAWKSSKQDTTADSTTEAEYIAASEAAKEAIWMKNYIQELGVVPSIAEPVVILCDNNGAIAQEKEPRSHHRSKHILDDTIYLERWWEEVSSDGSSQLSRKYSRSADKAHVTNRSSTTS